MNATQFLTPLFMISKLFGMCPFAINRNSYTRNNFNTIWACGFLFVYGSITFFVLTQPSNKHYGTIMSITDSMQVFVSLVGSVLTNFNIILYRKKVTIMVEKLQNIDKYIKELSSENVLNRKVFIGHLISVFITLLYLLIILCLDAHIYVKISFTSIARYITYCMPLVVSTIILIQYCTIVYMIRLWFLKINYKIERMLVQNSVKISNNTGTRSSFDFRLHQLVDHLENIKFIHYELFLTCEMINEIYALPLLAALIQIFLTLLSKLFFIVRGILKSNDSESLDPTCLVFTMSISVFCFYRVICFGQICGVTAKEGNRTAMLLQTFNVGDTVMLKIIQISQHFLYCKINFSVYGMFSVNEALILSVISALASYLIIVVQFEVGMKVK